MHGVENDLAPATGSKSHSIYPSAAPCGFVGLPQPIGHLPRVYISETVKFIYKSKY